MYFSQEMFLLLGHEKNVIYSKLVNNPFSVDFNFVQFRVVLLVLKITLVQSNRIINVQIIQVKKTLLHRNLRSAQYCIASIYSYVHKYITYDMIIQELFQHKENTRNLINDRKFGNPYYILYIIIEKIGCSKSFRPSAVVYIIYTYILCQNIRTFLGNKSFHKTIKGRIEFLKCYF